MQSEEARERRKEKVLSRISDKSLLQQSETIKKETLAPKISAYDQYKSQKSNEQIQELIINIRTTIAILLGIAAGWLTGDKDNTFSIALIFISLEVIYACGKLVRFSKNFKVMVPGKNRVT